MPKRYITHEKKMYKQNGGGFLDFFKKTDSVPSTTPDTSNGGRLLDFFKKKKDSSNVPSTTPDSSNVPSTTPDSSNVPSTTPDSEYSDNYLDYEKNIQTRKISRVTLTDKSKGKLYFCTTPGNSSLIRILDQNNDKVTFKIIKGAGAGFNNEIKKENLKYYEFYEPIKKDSQDGGKRKRKSRRNRKSRQNQRKKSRQSRRR